MAVAYTIKITAATTMQNWAATTDAAATGQSRSIAAKTSVSPN